MKKNQLHISNKSTVWLFVRRMCCQYLRTNNLASILSELLFMFWKNFGLMEVFGSFERIQQSRRLFNWSHSWNCCGSVVLSPSVTLFGVVYVPRVSKVNARPTLLASLGRDTCFLVCFWGFFFFLFFLLYLKWKGMKSDLIHSKHLVHTLGFNLFYLKE